MASKASTSNATLVNAVTHYGQPVSDVLFVNPIPNFPRAPAQPRVQSGPPQRPFFVPAEYAIDKN
jgi:hypothetical protein